MSWFDNVMQSYKPTSSSITSKRSFYRDGVDGTFLDGTIKIGEAADADAVQEIPSTAIASARYNPADDTLNIAYRSNPDQEYTFRAGGQAGLEEWFNAPSKGQITNEWRRTHHI